MEMDAVKESGVSVRVVDCIPGGLQLARNCGLLEASGEIVLYLDDDAAAAPDCLEWIAAAYREREDLAVAGGTIVLEPPDPPPWWYGKELAVFWSEFSPEQDTLYVFDDWRAFPFGALWSARRQALLDAGGFRSRYDRNGRAAQAGGETVAALSVQALGHKIGCEPHARVRHIPEPDRFRLRTLMKSVVYYAFGTILLMQMEGRIAPMLRLHMCLARGLVRFGMAATPGFGPVARRVKNLAYGLAQIRSAALLFRNAWRRFVLMPAEWKDAP